MRILRAITSSFRVINAVQFNRSYPQGTPNSAFWGDFRRSALRIRLYLLCELGNEKHAFKRVHKMKHFLQEIHPVALFRLTVLDRKSVV